MARPRKDSFDLGLPPLRQYWQQINREERETQAHARSNRKASDKKRRKCRCAAYPWPHRPGGGLCSWPQPPVERWEPKAGRKPCSRRYAGILRQIARANGLHPIRDRAVIEALMPRVLAQAKQVKRLAPRAKYRFMEITEDGVRGQWQSAGPMM